MLGIVTYVFTCVQAHIVGSVCFHIFYALLLATTSFFLIQKDFRSSRKTNPNHSLEIEDKPNPPPGPSIASLLPHFLEAREITRLKAPILRLDPIPPIDEYDKRPAVRDLLAENAQAVASLRGLVAQDPLFNPAVHDDLWLLRFVLSHSKQGPERGFVDAASATAKDTAKAARATLKYRHGRGLDLNSPATEADLLAAWPCAEHPKLALFFSLLKGPGAYHCYWPDRDRGVVLLVELSGLDMHAMVKSMTYEQNLEKFMAFNEWSHQVGQVMGDEKEFEPSSENRLMLTRQTHIL